MVCAHPWWWGMENMRFPRQSRVGAHMNRSHSGPRCLLPLITPHLRQVLCCIFNGMERLFISRLAFLPRPKSSVRDDKLQFGVRSSEILTRASSKPLNQWLKWYIHKSMGWSWQLRDRMRWCRKIEEEDFPSSWSVYELFYFLYMCIYIYYIYLYIYILICPRERYQWLISVQSSLFL